jgi:transposase
MNAYCEDLRKKKIVEATESGMLTVEVARTFGVDLSSVESYAKVSWEGGSLRHRCARRGVRADA